MAKSSVRENGQSWKRRLLVVALLFAGVGIFLVQTKKSCKRLECLSIKGMEEYQLEKIYREDEKVYSLLLNQEANLLRIEAVSDVTPEEAERQITSRVAQMKGLFERAISPYPGEISDAIECGEEYIPKFAVEEINGLEIHHFSGFMNDRLVFGVCTQEQATHGGIFAIFYCPDQRQLYQVEIIAQQEEFFSAPEQYEQMLRSIECKAS